MPGCLHARSQIRQRTRRPAASPSSSFSCPTRPRPCRRRRQAWRVDVFLISGFLIVGELHRNRQAVERDTMTRRHALALFLAKRALRIFPVYYLLLAALAIAHALFYQRGVNLARVARGVPVELLDRRRQDGWPGSTSHFWSLAVEQQFYLIAPLALLAVPAARHVALGIGPSYCARSRISRSVRRVAGADLCVFPWNFALIALGGVGAMALADRGAAAVRRVPPGWLGAAGVVFFLVLPACMPCPTRSRPRISACPHRSARCCCGSSANPSIRSWRCSTGRRSPISARSATASTCFTT